MFMILSLVWFISNMEVGQGSQWKGVLIGELVLDEVQRCNLIVKIPSITGTVHLQQPVVPRSAQKKQKYSFIHLMTKIVSLEHKVLSNCCDGECPRVGCWTTAMQCSEAKIHWCCQL